MIYFAISLIPNKRQLLLDTLRIPIGKCQLEQANEYNSDISFQLFTSDLGWHGPASLSVIEITDMNPPATRQTENRRCLSSSSDLSGQHCWTVFSCPGSSLPLVTHCQFHTIWPWPPTWPKKSSKLWSLGKFAILRCFFFARTILTLSACT